MSPLTALGIFGAGLAAGTVNTIVGSGSLISFPTLLAAGYSPVLANVSNTLGLVPGSLSGAYGYRRELAGQSVRIRRLGVASALGGITGACLLLILPGDVFRSIVPALILLACALVAVQPRLTKRLAARTQPPAEHGGPWLLAGIYATGVYGGYFGAGQGIILLALLAISVPDTLQRLNGAKNVLAALVNGIAALLFILLSDVAWEAVGLIALGAIIGGQIGATVGRRLPAPVMRAAIIVVGVAVAVKLML